MHHKLLSAIAIACLILIFASQAYLVYDYFNTTKASLIRESDVILHDIFKKDLETRRLVYKKLNHEDTIVTPPPISSVKNVEEVNLKDAPKSEANMIDLIDIAINMNISKQVPLNLKRLDSITDLTLRKRDIYSKHRILIVNTKNDSVVAQTGAHVTASPLLINSKNFIYDAISQKALRLQLINPFGVIIKRMSLMLVSSVLFSLICIWAFVYLQRILSRQKKLVAFKNDFLSNIAHELKRPVASLTFNLDALSLAGADEKYRRMLLNNSLRSTDEMSHAILMIVALSKAEEGLLKLKPESIEMINLLETLRERFIGIANKKTEIEIEHIGNDSQIKGDFQLLNACFANLIDNAIKYSGKEVKIKAIVKKSDGRLTVSITDNGNGIPSDKLPFIFEKYNRGSETRSSEGYGIGLNYVKTIVEKHHGQVTANSILGAGSEFTVTLPC
jgi:two-component system, OmpR family, phosphate regulon sensor histidine kinase PhoR